MVGAVARLGRVIPSELSTVPARRPAPNPELLPVLEGVLEALGPDRTPGAERASRLSALAPPRKEERISLILRKLGAEGIGLPVDWEKWECLRWSNAHRPIFPPDNYKRGI
jgi:hypothetical protein